MELENHHNIKTSSETLKRDSLVIDSDVKVWCCKLLWKHTLVTSLHQYYWATASWMLLRCCLATTLLDFVH